MLEIDLANILKLIMNKVPLLAVVASIANGLTIFDDDHDFMKGFETGVMMRSKGTKVEEFGCKVPSDNKPPYQGLIDNLTLALSSVKPFLPDDLDIETSYDMLLTYVDGLSGLISVIDPNSKQFLDDYCRGMIFGVNGTNLIVKVATELRKVDRSNINLVPSKDGKRMRKSRRGKRGGKDNNLSVDNLKKAGADVLKNLKKNMQKNDEL